MIISPDLTPSVYKELIAQEKVDVKKDVECIND